MVRAVRDYQTRIDLLINEKTFRSHDEFNTYNRPQCEKDENSGINHPNYIFLTRLFY